MKQTQKTSFLWMLHSDYFLLLCFQVLFLCDTVCAQLLSRVWSFATPWTVARQAPLSMGFPRQEYWSGLPFPSPGGSSWPRDRTRISYVSCIASEFFTTSTTWEAPRWGSCCSILSHWEGDYNSNRTESRLCSILRSNLNGKRIWRRIDTCGCVTESFCCTPEANTTLLISCRWIDR